MFAVGINPLGDCVEAMSVPGFVAVVTQVQLAVTVVVVTAVVLAAFYLGRARR